MLMITSAWADIVQLACESSEYTRIGESNIVIKSKNSLSPLIIDTKKQLVLIEAKELKYREEGNRIYFEFHREYKESRESTWWNLDRVTGALYEEYDFSDPEWSDFGRKRNYKCIPFKRLF